MDRDELVDALEDAGLSPYQADAYVTVLEFGSGPVTDIGEASGVPDPRIYDVLRDLEDAGYVELYEQDSLHARAHDLTTLREHLEDRASRFTNAAEELERRWETPTIEETVVSIVRRFETVLDKAEEYITTAETQIQLSLSPEHFEHLEPALRAAYAGGVSVRLSLYTDRNTPEAEFPDREELQGVCTEARYRTLPSPFVAVVDRTKTCFAPHAGSTNEYGVLVDDRTHAYVFHWFFMTTQWDACEPYYLADTETTGEEYVDIRYCIRDIRPLLEEGAGIRLRVDGIDTRTGEDRTVEGQVSDVMLSGSRSGDEASITTFGGQVALELETDDGAVEIGGWGAMVEEVEAHRIRILDLE